MEKGSSMRKIAGAAFALLLAFNAHAALKDLKPGWNLFSRQEDVQLGREAQAQVGKERRLVQNPRLEAYVTRIGHILMRSPHAGDWPYEFHIVNDKNINAFSLPGGFVYINTGAIEF
jgi:predicted Zn-dependent protease